MGGPRIRPHGPSSPRYIQYIKTLTEKTYMGCDIHVMVERRMNGRWVGIHKVDDYTIRPAGRFSMRLGDEKSKDLAREDYYFFSHVHSRNYDFFARLAGVRGGGSDAKGVPDDVSEWVKDEIEGWGEDGHSHSWESIADFTFKYYEGDPVKFKKFALGKIQNDPEVIEKAVKELWGLDIDEDHSAQLNDFRVVFWFDN